ncbi:MAG: diguanylate cyclase (GGDEF)-like protein/PAS domain S-box-containing protein [Colwellia sp.]
MNRKYLKKNHRIDLPLNLAVLVIYLGLAKLSSTFSIIDSSGIIFWPASGLSLGVLLIAGPKCIPAIFGGAVVSGLMIGDTLSFSSLAALGNTLETLCAFWLLTYFRPINRSLNTYQDLFKLLFYGAILSTLISVIIVPLSLVVLQQVELSLLPSIALRWWMAHALGITLVTPLILLWYQSRQHLENKISLELISLFSLTILIGHGVSDYGNDMQVSGLVNLSIFGIFVGVGGMIISMITAENRKNQNKARINTMESSDKTRKPIPALGINTDITDLKIYEDKLKLAASVFTHAQEGIMVTDTKACIIEVNDAFIKMTGYSREELITQNPRMLQSGRQPLTFYENMWKELTATGQWTGELWNRRKDGEFFAVRKNISAVYDEHGIITNYVAMSTDITLMKEHQGQLERNAHFDVLTNLPNRVLLADRLSQAMLQCNRHEKSLAVVFLDLDGFKGVNDAYGHSVGDELLIALSARMKEALREGDSLARIGGDEFVAVLTDLTTVEDCEPALERLLLAASEPTTIGGVVLNVSASIGVTLYPQDNVNVDQLVRHADQAMYVAKQSGKNHYHLFDTVQDVAIKVQRESLEAIRSALDEQQFLLYYQPKVNIKTGTVTGCEALIRWQHQTRGLLNPIEFLPVIENHPMMIEVGEWVIDTALTQISQWQTMGLTFPVGISVNIAAIQLQQPNFTERLIKLLDAHPDVEPCHLELEVLETSAIDDVQHVSTIMNTCMALGVKFALDDFGTGYSSLTYLRRLPASLIKIDQIFVRDMLINADDLAIVEGVIALAKSFKCDVIAEGVETVEHGRALLLLGCDLAQGYGIAKPMPANSIPAWISNWKPDVSWQI